jgi:hypothetical protein
MAGIIDSVRWYRSRLAAMDAPELGHRVAEQISRISGRRFNRDWIEIPATGNIVPLLNLRRTCNEMPEPLKVRIAEQARKTIAGQFDFLGAPWTHASRMPPAPGFWYLDPQCIPWSSSDKYCFAIPYRSYAGREVKQVWELNRLQFLVTLAVHARLTGDRQPSKLILDIIRSWMLGNPPYRGVNWISGVELALRAISVAVALSIVGLQGIKEADRMNIERFFSAHLFWLRRYPSLYSSENNHRIAELAGSLVCTAFAPSIDRDKNSSEELNQLLIQLQSQILRDGIGAEQSLAYAAFSIELALTAFVSLNLLPERLPKSVRDRLLAWADHVQWISSPAGDVPMIGDCDDGKVVGIDASAGPHYVVSIARSVANFLNCPFSLPTLDQLDLRDVLFFPPRTSTIGSPAKQPIGAKTWEVGGYSVWRKRPSRPAVLIFDHGSLGYLSIAAHGHADALSVWLSIGETPVIVDAGTYVYNSAPLWRERLRSSMSHNTLSICGVSSSSTSGSFNWAHKANARLVCGPASSTNEVIAEHDGYLRRFGVRHRRSVSMSDDGRVSIADELIGGGVPLPVQISFLINPQLSARTNNSRPNSIVVENADHPVAEINGDGTLGHHIAFGDGDTGRGWVSLSFGQLNAAHQVLFEGLLSGKSILEIVPLGP